MSAFATAARIVLAEEGGVANHAADPGGLTNLGITHGTLERARPYIPNLPRSVTELTLQQALMIYWHLYWAPAQCAQLPDGVAVFAFDAAVQHGPDDAIRFLQLALGIFADGVWGPITAQRVRAVKDWPTTLREMAARRAFHYMKLDAIDDIFGLGWSRRLFRVYDAATALLPR